jgi:hypothetical protein
VPFVPGVDNGVAECPFCVSAGEERFSDETQVGCVVNVSAWFVILESSGEFVGVIENLLCGAGHGGSPQVLRSSWHGVNDEHDRRRVDEHGEPVVEVVHQDRIVEGVDHVVVADAVSACAGR